MRPSTPGPPVPPESPPSLLQINKTFTALRVPAYRFLWFSMLASFSGMQMQQIARSVLAYQIGKNASSIAFVSVGSAIPMLIFSLIGGTVADRMDKRKLMILSQATTAAVAVSIAILVKTDYINLWWLFLSGLVQGTVFSFSGPARSAYIPELVGEKHLLNAIALNSAGMNVTRIAGPSIGGALIAVDWIDVEGVFLIQAALNCVSLGFLSFLPFAGKPPGDVEVEAPRHQRHRRDGLSREFLDGVHYVMRSPILLTLLMMGLVPTLLGATYQSFLPIFAKDVFGNGVDRNSEGLGLMMTMSGVGALAGSLIVASMQDFPRRTQLQLLAGLGLGISLAFFAMQSQFAIALLGLTCLGFMSTYFAALNSTMIMTASDPDYYGRVMSVNMMTFSLMPLGTLPAGLVADALPTADLGFVTLLGVQMVQIASGTIVVGFILAVTVLNPAYRRLEQDDLKRFASIAAERVRKIEDAAGAAWQDAPPRPPSAMAEEEAVPD